MVRQISVHEVKALLESGEPVFLLDVREPEEYAFCRLAGSVLIPLGELSSRVDEVPADANVVVYCHHGVRSIHGALCLQQAGYENVASMRGGIDAWSLHVDTAVKRY